MLQVPDNFVRIARRFSAIIDEDDLVQELQARKCCNSEQCRYSPNLDTKRDHSFSIPRAYEGSPTLQQKYASLDLQQLDVKDYKRKDRKISLVTLKDGNSGKILGEISFVLLYVPEEEALSISLKHVDKIGTPSPTVIGTIWNCVPECVISLLPEKRLFFDKKGFKHKWNLKERSTIFVPIKKSEINDKTLRLTVYDANRSHNYLPIGHVLVSLKDLENGRMYPFVKPISVYSEAAGFNRGTLDLSVTWIALAEKLEVKIGKVSRLRSPRGILGRDFYVKMYVFIGSEEERSFKTVLQKAQPDLDFKEKFVISLQSAQVRDVTLLFFVYAKQLVTSELIGTTVIGPYMNLRLHDNLTQWETMIMRPVEEVTVTHTLFV